MDKETPKHSLHRLLWNVFLISTGISLLAGFLLVWKSSTDLRPLPANLKPSAENISKVQILDRNGTPLSVTYLNRWNLQDWVELHEVPPLLLQAFIDSEDKRFFEHNGIDWLARWHAVLQNVMQLRVVRGASTISEQVVRMLHPRRRTIWSRWLESIESVQLEQRFSKAEILEFYINQVPYARQRRGVVQAARLYFNRDLDTLNLQEMLSLVVLVRAPTALDLHRNLAAVQKPVARLAHLMFKRGHINKAQYRAALQSRHELEEFSLPVDAGHFVRHLYRSGSAEPEAARASEPDLPGGCITSTLDGSLQSHVQKILDSRLRDLKSSNVNDGAVLVVDNRSDEVLTWVNGGGFTRERPGELIDAVTLARQPGSTLKPFLYALALDLGWTAATLIDDSPLAESIGSGLHTFHNFSRVHYGPLRLREALGNSLNVPAVRTVQFTGTGRFLRKLHECGFESLSQPSEYYGEGLALGNGGVSLFELVRAYAVLARGGIFRPLKLIKKSTVPNSAPKRVFSKEAAAIVADILSDPQARAREFGYGHLLRFPSRIAVKTGTSNDHIDAWTVAFSDRYTVGVWMGNLAREPTNGITGSTGPALVVRSVFAELTHSESSQPLRPLPSLFPVKICRITGLRAGADCPQMTEWFRADKRPDRTCRSIHSRTADVHQAQRRSTGGDKMRLLQPTQGLLLAMDPRIPDELEAFAFLIPPNNEVQKVEWIVDGKVVGVTKTGENRFMWPLQKGSHSAQARIWQGTFDFPLETAAVQFLVK